MTLTKVKHLCYSNYLSKFGGAFNSRWIHSQDTVKISRPTKLDDTLSEGCKSQKLMLQEKLILGASAGTFYLLPWTTRALEKLYKVIDQEMRSVGASKITMPCLAPGQLWKATKRWDDMGSELFTLTDRHDTDHCLAPTHEEAVTSIVASDYSLSYRKLPIKLYQIGRKFRDEMRPKNGLLRCREFEMKDLYTFDKDEEAAKETYDSVCEAYRRMFVRLGLDYVQVEGDTGAMGGKSSHEFHLQSSIGEDDLYVCRKCNKGFNSELIEDKDPSEFKCGKPECGPDFERKSGIEIAHAFILGTKYSKVFKAKFADEMGGRSLLYMGCYGIGVTRLLAASLEVLSTDTEIRWPKILAPKQVCIVPQKKGYMSDKTDQLAAELHEKLCQLPNLQDEITLDDRNNMSIGKRLYDAKKQGYPYVICVGKQALEESPLYEVVDVNSGNSEHQSLDQIMDIMSGIKTIIL